MSSKAREQMAAAIERYHPCFTGIHICGADEGSHEFITVKNYPMPNARRARIAFAAAKAECEARPDDPTDVVVDLVINRDIDHDFRMTRQMMDRLDAVLKICAA